MKKSKKKKSKGKEKRKKTWRRVISQQEMSLKRTTSEEKNW